MSTPEEDTLSAEDQAYFDNKGEAPAQEKPEPEALEPVEEPEDEEIVTDEPKAAKTVPLAALTKTREETKALKAALEEQKTRNAIWEDRWNTLLRQQQPVEQQVAKDEDPEPDPNVDIFAHQQWLGRQLKAERETRAKQEQEQARQREEQHVEQQIWTAWEQDAATYVADNADFPNAAKWLSDFRDAQLKALGKVDERFADARARNMQIEQELKQIVIGAKQRGLSSAQVIYELAQGYGYTPKAAETQTDAAGALDRLEKSVAGATSLSATGGARPAAGLDAAAIANMSPEQFGAWLAKNGERGFKKLAGG